MRECYMPWYRIVARLAPGNTFTKAEAKLYFATRLMALNARGLTHEQIARKLCMSRDQVTYWVAQRGRKATIRREMGMKPQSGSAPLLLAPPKVYRIVVKSSGYSFPTKRDTSR